MASPGAASPQPSQPARADAEEMVAFRRNRLALYFRLIALLSGGFYVAGHFVMLLISPANLLTAAAHPANIAHLFGTLFAGAAWLAVRRSAASARAIEVLDTSGTFVICATYSFLVAGHHDGNRPELVMLLATSWTLVARAALVPCRARKTAIVGVIGMVPVLGATYAIARETPAPFAKTVYAGFWAFVAIITTTVVSRIIYGLEKQIRDAMRVGQYTLEEKIGEGGMGVVYRASHALLRRPTAIKLLHADRTSERDRARFEREVQMTAQLTHANTIAIYDYGRTPDGVFYYAMEYLDGITLEELVELDGPQPPARVAHLLAQVCGALDEAHEAGLVHRDIKPANVILSVRGGVPDVVKVLDFGLVKIVAPDVAPEAGSEAMLAGTPLYMAPESITTPDAVDRRSDLYALGATAYFLLTGSPPFQATTIVEACGKHLHEDPQAPSERLGKPIPAQLEALVLRCLSKEPDARAESAARLAIELASSVGERWSDTEARAWWQTKGATVLARARQRREAQARTGKAGPKTVAVDVSGRAAA